MVILSSLGRMRAVGVAEGCDEIAVQVDEVMEESEGCD